jgi:hypothetical protein
MARTYEFASTEWVSAVGAIIKQHLTGLDLSGIDFCVCEELTDPPPEYCRSQENSIGWFFRVRGGEVDVGDRPTADTDLRVVADYQTHHDLSRRVWGDDPNAIAAAQRARQAAVAKGKLRTEGSLAAAPAVIRDLIRGLHDPVAAITA